MHESYILLKEPNMSVRVAGTFEVTSWSEEQTTGLDGTAKVATARIGQRFTGGIEAETISDTLMTYRDDGTAEFVGYQRVDGAVGDKTGTFVLQSLGHFDGKEATAQVEVVLGTGSGDLAGLTGNGSWAAPQGSTGTFVLDYDL
jgi:hypothetical protein